MTNIPLPSHGTPSPDFGQPAPTTRPGLRKPAPLPQDPIETMAHTIHSPGEKTHQIPHYLEHTELQKDIDVQPIAKNVKKDVDSKSTSKIHHVKSDVTPYIDIMYEAGIRTAESLHQEFLTKVCANASPDEKIKLTAIADKCLAQTKQTLTEEHKNHPLLSQKPNEAANPTKKEVEEYKAIAKSTQQGIHKEIGNFGTSLLLSLEKELPNIKDKQLFIDFTANVKDKASNLEGIKRFEIIHEDPMWDPTQATERHMAFTSNKTGESVKSTSSFQAAGPAYSSQAPRNRTKENAHPANFFSTKLSLKEETGETAKEALQATRSAITVEFSQANPTERKEANKALVKHVLDYQTKEMLEEHTFEELLDAQDPATPITLTSDTINLLTTDKLRSWAKDHSIVRDIGSKLHHAITGAPADDERSLARENLEAHKHWNGKVEPFTVENSNGDTITVYVKFDVRYFNIPNNVLQEKTPEFLTYSKELDAANKESWNKLDTDVREQITNLNEELETKSKTLTPEDKKWLTELQALQAEKMSLREDAKEITIEKKDRDASAPQMAAWKKQADAIAEQFQAKLKDPNLSDEMRAFVTRLEERENYIDLYLDTSELFLSGLSSDVKNMDNNRSALATRIITLSALTESHKTHFGCRSGKDRTGLVDIEIKLLLTEAKLLHRMPSYREQERMVDTVDHREIMTMESGNVFDIVKAVMGASVGLNSAGSAFKAFELNAATTEKQNEFTETAQAFSKMASLVPAKGNVPAGFMDKQDTRIIVQNNDS